MHVRKGDQVVVIAGKEKGKRGRVLRLLTGAGRVVIERVNMVKRHTKPSQRNPRGGIVEKEGSVESSNVSLWCNKCVAPRRSKVQAGEGKGKGTEGQAQKRRICIKCSTVFETS
jgi:large subunit ribosomal protein L24